MNCQLLSRSPTTYPTHRTFIPEGDAAVIGIYVSLPGLQGTFRNLTIKTANYLIYGKALWKR